MSPTRARLIAWALVGLQFALIAALVLLPSGSLWPTPTPVLVLARAAALGGIALMVVAGLSLGRGLTAAPLPNAHAQLRTGGLYRFVRHPIYSGLLLFAMGQVLASASLLTCLAGALLTVLISVKVRWEERRLAERFAGYPEYAARTPRFVPGWPAPRPSRGH